jgi:hypothetical protein
MERRQEINGRERETGLYNMALEACYYNAEIVVYIYALWKVKMLFSSVIFIDTFFVFISFLFVIDRNNIFLASLRCGSSQNTISDIRDIVTYFFSFFRLGFFFYSFYIFRLIDVYGISLMRRERRKAIDQTFLRHKPVGDETMKNYMYIRKKTLSCQTTLRPGCGSQ